LVSDLFYFWVAFLPHIGIHEGIECVRCFDRLREAGDANAKPRW
jgi:hypothetical protein